MRFLSYPQLRSERGINYSRRHLRRLTDKGLFPKPVPISVGPDGKASRIGWIEAEVDQWQADKVSLRDPPPPEPEPGSGSAPVIPIGRQRRSLPRGSPADRDSGDTRPPHR